MSFRSGAVSSLLVALCGCGGGAAQPVAKAPERKPGSSLDEPVPRCGPRDSYQWVASSFRCPDGANPFAGDPRRAASARSGSQQNPKTGHLVDTYEVPCSSGSVTVFIDMYGCAEYQKLLSGEKSSVLADVERRFDAGDYAEVVRRCEDVFAAGEPLDAWSMCGAFEPAALGLLGDRRAIDIMRRTCDPLPPDGPKSDARQNAVSLAVLALARGARQAGPDLDARAASGVLIAFSEACEVDPKDVVRRLEAESA